MCDIGYVILRYEQERTNKNSKKKRRTNVGGGEGNNYTQTHKKMIQGLLILLSELNQDKMVDLNTPLAEATWWPQRSPLKGRPTNTPLDISLKLVVPLKGDRSGVRVLDDRNLRSQLIGLTIR